MRRVNWGPQLVTRLLPHGRPFLMVDTVRGFTAEPLRLRARRTISVNEPVFDGHFPELPLWPGVYTIEALAQSCHLLLTLSSMARAHPEGESGLMRDLSLLSSAMRMEPVPGGEEAIERARDLLPTARGQDFGVMAGVDVRLKRPVFAGDVLELQVALESVVQGMSRVAVEAGVGPRTVASGVLTLVPRPPPPGFGQGV